MSRRWLNPPASPRAQRLEVVVAYFWVTGVLSVLMVLAWLAASVWDGAPRNAWPPYAVMAAGLLYTAHSLGRRRRAGGLSAIVAFGTALSAAFWSGTFWTLPTLAAAVGMMLVITAWRELD